MLIPEPVSSRLPRLGGSWSGPAGSGSWLENHWQLLICFVTATAPIQAPAPAPASSQLRHLLHSPPIFLTLPLVSHQIQPSNSLTTTRHLSSDTTPAPEPQPDTTASSLTVLHLSRPATAHPRLLGHRSSTHRPAPQPLSASRSQETRPPEPHLASSANRPLQCKELYYQPLTASHNTTKVSNLTATPLSKPLPVYRLTISPTTDQLLRHFSTYASHSLVQTSSRTTFCVCIRLSSRRSSSTPSIQRHSVPPTPLTTTGASTLPGPRAAGLVAQSGRSPLASLQRPYTKTYARTA